MIKQAIETTHWDVYWKSEREPYGSLGMDILGSLLIVLVYLTLVLRIGPSFMEKRQPYKLKYAMLFYNVIQVLVSIYLGQSSFAEMADYGYLPGKCHNTSDDTFRNKVAFGIWLFFLAKLSELIDTAFFVLRKKKRQLSFLHISHHSIMLLCFVVFRRDPSHISSFVRFLNSNIHIAVYAYYGLSTLGPKYAKCRTWKKYVTIFELIQFVLGVAYCLLEPFSDCPTSTGHIILYVMIGTFFFVLFTDFYINNYMDKPNVFTEAVPNNNNIVTNTPDHKSQ